MKAILSMMVAMMIAVSLNAQTPDTTKTTKVDTTNFNLGKKEIRIVEKDGETEIKLKDRVEKDQQEKHEDNDNDENDNYNGNDNDRHDYTWHNDENKKGKSFKGHWDAFQIGINSYVSADKSTTLPDDIDFMSLNTNKSININLDMFQQSFGIIGKHVGLVSGLGLEFTNYVFDGDNTIDKGENGSVVAIYPPYKLDKSKLTTTYLTVPLLLEFQFPGDKRSNRLYINGGIVGGVKLGSHTKYKYKENGDKQTKKNRDDFNLNSLRYGFTGRIGIKHISLYGTYYPVSLFEKKGTNPELYPFMVGFSFDGF